MDDMFIVKSGTMKLEKITSKETDPFLRLASSFQHTMILERKSQEAVFRELLLNDCKNEEKQLELFRLMALTGKSYGLNGIEKGIKVVTAGAVAYALRCPTVEVQLRHPQKCYTVSYNI